MQAMKKYYIGLVALGLVTVGLLVFTLMQASPAKQDAKTSQAISQIADKLNSYTSNGGVPDSLEQAGIKDVPSTISYVKTNDGGYRVCANYNNASDMFDAGWGGMFGQIMMGYGSGSQPYYPGSTPSPIMDSSIVYFHKKGQNCQTIQPDLYNLQNSDQKTPTTTTGA